MDWTTFEAWMAEYPEVIWAIIAAFFFIIEVGVVTGFGFFFAAVAALTMSLLLVTDVIDPTSFWWHVGYFFVLTAFWTILLWKPVKRWFGDKAMGYNDMIGSRAIAEEDLSKGKTGKVRWSGTIMRARVAESAKKDKLEAGTELYVVDKDGSVLLVDTEK